MKGEYQHTLDSKQRLFIPAKLREELGETVVITNGLDGCLFMYSQEEWKKMERSILQLPSAKSRKLARYFIAAAKDVSVDKQGRITIPSELRDSIGLTKDVTIAGMLSRAEIWDTATWKKYNEDVLDADDIAASMEELGF